MAINRSSISQQISLGRKKRKGRVMPKVGSKTFPYTKKGKVSAIKYAKKMGDSKGKKVKRKSK